MRNWKFSDPPNAAVITTKKIADRSTWIGYVGHDAEDGGWQFLEPNRAKQDTQNAAVISLKEIVEIDPSVVELADLPLGWYAWRLTKTSVWVRKTK